MDNKHDSGYDIVDEHHSAKTGMDNEGAKSINNDSMFFRYRFFIIIIFFFNHLDDGPQLDMPKTGENVEDSLNGCAFNLLIS